MTDSAPWNAWFSQIASAIAKQTGSAWFFSLSLASILVWLALGPFYQWSQGWQLIMNSATTVLTWQLAILILHTQNRDTKAVQLKLDELVLATQGARNELAAAEDMGEAELDRIKARQSRLVLALVCLLLLPSVARAETVTVIATKVLDGDTLGVESGPNLRLFGLDAPEIAHSSKQRSQPYGLEAQAKLTELVAGKVLRCRVEGLDRYSRMIVACRDGVIDINRAMVASGLALAYRTYSLRYEAEEQAAACAGIGIWASTALPPWHWRHCNAGSIDP